MFAPLWRLIYEMGFLVLMIIAAVFDNEWDWDKYNGK